ncbi:unnamed protein product [Ceutorhynchus assimilis]|uniref:Uncharacterized protein n=1 Tax=Ceutorhynchus assimilis TaxID=467358 RepID=A0A9N9MH78_9CUCU|nr:unnamed protein product [Ceutorhynchus assimilis]
MSKEADEIRYSCEELRVIYRNLVKDNADRRSNFKVLEYKLEKLNRLKLEFTENREKFNSELCEPKLVDRIKSYVVDIEKYFDASYGIVTQRLNKLKLNPVEPEVDFEHDSTDKELKMSEKFDLKTAAGLIPVMNGSEAVTNQLIVAIGLYDSLLDIEGISLDLPQSIPSSSEENVEDRRTPPQSPSTPSSNGADVQDESTPPRGQPPPDAAPKLRIKLGPNPSCTLLDQ